MNPEIMSEPVGHVEIYGFPKAFLRNAISSQDIENDLPKAYKKVQPKGS